MQCKNCGKDFELSAGQPKCPYCETEPNSNPGLTPPPECKSNKLLWDNEGPFFTRLFNTWVEVMFHSTRFFKYMPVSGIGKPLVYGLILGSLGVIVGTFWQLLFTMMQVSFIPSFGNHDRFAQMGIFAFSTVYYIVLMVFSPLIILIGQFIWSGILHLCLMIFSGNKKGFEATFRVVSYGSYSPGVFTIIPFCGGMVGGIWSIVLVIIGLKETHQIPTWKAVLAYFLPLIFCCCCVFILAVIFGGFGAFMAASAAKTI